ncbi:MAG: hypothetical protein ACPGO5_00455 [Patescibacteria group bacterium]
MRIRIKRETQYAVIKNPQPDLRRRVTTWKKTSLTQHVVGLQNEMPIGKVVLMSKEEAQKINPTKSIIYPVTWVGFVEDQVEEW